MRHIERILVVVKNPEAKCSAAVLKATQLARSGGAHIELLFATERPEVDSEPLLEHLALQVNAHGVTASTSMRSGRSIHEAVLDQAEITRADLIVTDSYAGAHIAPSLLQMTDWELARLSPVPVLIVKRPVPYRAPKVLAAVDPTHAYSKPLDLDTRILASGVAISEALRGTLHAVHAYVPAPCGAEPSIAASAGTAMPIDSIAAADARLQFNRVLQLTGIPAECRHLKAGHPADTIKQVVEQTGADIVVMGTMSRSGLRRLLIGNTAEKLLYRLPCDLLLVKPGGIASMFPRQRGRSRVVLTTACS